MKTKIITSALFVIVFSTSIFAQDRTTVNATSSEISDNLDLRAIASIFGDAQNLEDFERQLNDPKIQISNLDLNDDNQVDYLRVIESVEGNTHLIIVQSVLGRDTFQDVATIEVEKDRNNKIQVQVVGDVYMYGQNYIYEPVYVHAPIIFTSFWVNHYRPYSSVWYWNYYPTYYYAWNPCPIFRYRNNINVYINFNNQYNYVNYRRSQRAVALYDNRRSNYCERQYPNRSFAQRNTNTVNRYELDRTRTIKTVGSRNGLAFNNTRNSSTRENQRINSNGTRNTSIQRGETNARTITSPSRDPNRSNGDINTRINPVSTRNTSIQIGNTNGRTITSPTRENNGSSSDVNTRTNSVLTRDNNMERGETSGRTISSPNRENTTQRPQKIERQTPNYSNQENRRSENSSPRSMSQARNESPRTNSETRSTPQGENQQARNTSSSENNGGRNSRR